MTDRLSLPLRYRKQLEALLREHVPGVEVWAYGSRVNGESHEGSDLDLVLRSPTLVPLDGGFYDLLEAIEKSNVPILVQAHDWAMLPESFHREIERNYVVVQERAKQATAGEWREVALGDVAEMHREAIDPSKYPDRLFSHFSIPAFDESGDPVNEFGSEIGSQKFIVPVNSVLLSRLNPRIPRVWIPRIGEEKSPIASTEFMVLTPKGIEDRFLKCLLISPAVQQSMEQMATGTSGSHQRVRPRDVLTIPVPLPPLPTQRAIAHILGTLDDKIELNRRMNETLEAMARALFKSWFVDFEPVRAKMEGRWRPGESLPGLPAEHYDLFPDRLVDSELGEIPEGWGVKTLGDCFDLTMGQSPPGSTYNDDGNGTPFYQGSTDFGERYPTNRRYCTEPARLAQTEDTLVSVGAPVGAINRAWERCCIGRGVAALRHKSGSAPYTYYAIWAAQPEIGQYEHTGTVFGAIGGQQFRALQMLEPLEETIAAFHCIGQDLDSRIRSNVDESRALATQRDTLLPKLVSGFVRVEMADEGAGSNPIPKPGFGARSVGDAVSPH